MFQCFHPLLFSVGKCCRWSLPNFILRRCTSSSLRLLNDNAQSIYIIRRTVSWPSTFHFDRNTFLSNFRLEKSSSQPPPCFCFSSCHHKSHLHTRERERIIFSREEVWRLFDVLTGKKFFFLSSSRAMCPRCWVFILRAIYAKIAFLYEWKHLWLWSKSSDRTKEAKISDRSDDRHETSWDKTVWEEERDAS